MFKKIFGTFKFDSSKIYVLDKVRTFAESEEEKRVTELK